MIMVLMMKPMVMVILFKIRMVLNILMVVQIFMKVPMFQKLTGNLWRFLEGLAQKVQLNLRVHTVLIKLEIVTLQQIQPGLNIQFTIQQKVVPHGELLLQAVVLQAA